MINQRLVMLAFSAELGHLYRMISTCFVLLVFIAKMEPLFQLNALTVLSHHKVQKLILTAQRVKGGIIVKMEVQL
jgi:hypothetical protein